MNMTMNRAENEITNPEKIQDIMRQAQICRIAMVEGDMPYVIPLNFVVSGDCLYFHSATKGKQIEILHKNKNVCFEIDIDTQIIEGETPCAWGMKYASVIGYGRAFFVNDRDGKVKALNLLMEKYLGPGQLYLSGKYSAKNNDCRREDRQAHRKEITASLIVKHIFKR
jgi:hypothetical protein